MARKIRLLDTARFDKLLRQANDAEIADVRMVADNQYEISQHKADLAFQKRATVEHAAPAEGAVAAPGPAAPALRFRGGARTANRPPALPMVGVVNMNGDAVPSVPAPVVPKQAPATEAPVAVAASPTAVAKAEAKPRRGKRGGAKPKAAAAPVAVAKVDAAKPSTAKKPSKPRTSKPRAG